MGTYRRWFRATAVGFAALVIAVPAAGAAIPHEAPAPSDRGTTETSAVPVTGLPYGTVAGTTRVVPSPEPTTPEPHAVTASGVDWRDAGIGAAIGMTAGLVIGASLLLVGRGQTAPFRV